MKNNNNKNNKNNKNNNDAKKTKLTYKRLLTYVKPYKWIFVLGIFGNMAVSSFDASFTYMLKPLMDHGFIDRDVQFIQMVPIAALILIALRGASNFIATYCMTYVARSVVMNFRQQLFRHYLALPAKFFDNTSSGILLSKLLYDVEQVAQVSTLAIMVFLQSGCLAIGLFVVMLLNSWRLTLLYLVTVPFIALIIKYMNTRTRRVSQKLQAAMGEVTEIAEETIEGYRVVRTYGAEQYECDKFDAATVKTRMNDMKVALTKSASTSGVLLVAAFGVSTILYLAMSPTSMFALSAGSFASFVAAMLAVLKPLKNLTSVSSTIQRGLTGAQSVFDLLDKPVENETGTQPLSKAVSGQITFDEVSLRYDEEQENILKGVSFTVQAGESVALVGRSGSGKSSLMSSLLRFYEITGGNILLDGINLRDIPLVDLRKQIAFVSQQVMLFNDTIANNIAYGNRDSVTRAQIEAAAKAAYAMPFIEEFPDGLDTMVGENGVLLSGGQRQRLAIARAILKDAPILILDEATSALDTESEKMIQAALEEVMRHRTTLVIAHRLSTIEQVNKIVVLDSGRLKEIGSHSELLDKQGLYAKLYSMQFGSMAGKPLKFDVKEALDVT